MFLRRAIIATGAAAAAVLVLSGCVGTPDTKPTDVADAEITYSFTDSSVPPQYHRSFTLTVENGVGTLVVSAYGDELSRTEEQIDQKLIDDLFAQYRAGDLDDVFDPNSGDDGCAGGTTYALELESADDEQATTSIYVCGGDSKELAAELRAATDPIVNTFDIEELTEGRY